MKFDPYTDYDIRRNKYSTPETIRCPSCKGTGKSKKYICNSCGKTHRFGSNYVLCVIQQQFDKKLKNKPLPEWTKKGTRKDWVKHYRHIQRYNWSILQYRILERDNRRCQDCSIKDDNIEMEVHHIIPRSTGGSDHPQNLKTLCKKCHRKYTNHLLKNKIAYDTKQTKIKGGM